MVTTHKNLVSRKQNSYLMRVISARANLKHFLQWMTQEEIKQRLSNVVLSKLCNIFSTNTFKKKEISWILKEKTLDEGFAQKML